MTTSHRIAEGVVLCLLFFAYPLRGQLSAPEILQKVGRAYQDLQAFSMEASSSTSFLAGHVSTYTTTHYELAVVRPGKLRLRVNNPDRDLTMISDGETTWTYDARRKEYTEESVAAFAAEEEEEEAGSDEERDVFSESQRMLVARYAALPRLAPNARPDRDDHIKVGGKQLACYVLEVRTTQGSHRVWIDKERFFVLRHKQVLNTKVSGVDARIETQINFKKLQVDAPPPDGLFAFTPPAKAKGVAALDLPGLRVNLTGKSAASFKLKDSQGETEVSLAELRGKVVLLDFWATWCMPCLKELPSIEKIARAYQDRGLVVLGVSHEDAGTVKNLLRKKKYTFTTLIDSRRAVHKQYAVRAFPTVVVINRDGVIAGYYVGTRTEEQLIAALKQAGM